MEQHTPLVEVAKSLGHEPVGMLLDTWISGFPRPHEVHGQDIRMFGVEVRKEPGNLPCDREKGHFVVEGELGRYVRFFNSIQYPQRKPGSGS